MRHHLSCRIWLWRTVLAAVFPLSACVVQEFDRGDNHTEINPAAWRFPPSPGNYDTPPRVLSGKAPLYPPEKALNGEPGKVSAEFVIGTDGLVHDISVLYASDPEFGLSFTLALRQLKIKPAEKAGVPVPVRTKFNYYYCVPPPGDDCHSL